MPGEQRRRLVALRVPPGPAFARALRAVWQAGNAALPLDPDAPAGAIDGLVAALRPQALVDARGERPLPGGAGVPDGTALVIATSGTAGTPKGVVLSHDALRASADAAARRLGLARTDRWLGCLPVHHIAGLMVLVRAWRAGTEPVLLPRFSVEAVEAARGATVVSLVPTMLARLLDAGVDLARFEAVLVGGAGTPPALVDRARQSGAAVTVSYGMTETCGGCVYDGMPLDGVEATVRGDGRIALRGPMLFDGYRDASGTADVLADGWFVTGDLGRFGPDGHLEVLGRADDVIVSGGANVSPQRVEDVLAAHPHVAEAAAVGRPDADWGEVVVAVVVPRGQPPGLEDLRAFVAERAGRWHAPRELVVVDALPRLATGKPDRAALRAAFGTARAGRPCGG